MAQDDVFRKVSDHLATFRPQIIDWQRQLVAINAVGPDAGGPGEGAKAAYLTELLTSWGLTVDNYPAPDNRVKGGRPNLITVLPGRRPEKVWVLSHLDIVPPGDETLWHSDPFTLKLEEDRLYGRGTEDDHHGIVMSLAALKACLDLGLTPERSIGLALVSDEETGNDKGLAYLMREHRHLFEEHDLIIVPDAGNNEGTMIEVAEKSILWLKLTLTGKQGHASRPEVANNTLKACAHVIVALEEALAREFPLTNPLFRPAVSTFEPTRKEANVPNINTIPGRDVFYLDCRVLPDYDLSRVKDLVKEIGTAAAGKFGVGLEVEPVQTLAASPPTPPEATVVQALTRAIARVYHRQATPTGIGGGTVASFFRQAGFAAAVWMTTDDTAHQPNEFCTLSKLIGDAQVLAHVFLAED